MISDCVYYHYLNSLLDGNKKDCKKIVTDLLNNEVSPKYIYIYLIQRSMYRVGQLWESNKISVSKEHIASQITRQLLELVQIRTVTNNNSVKKALIACVEKEFHDIGAQMISHYLELIGYEVFYLGANVPSGDILSAIEEFNPDLVGISSNFYINVIRLTKLIEEINYKFGEKEILIGGQALLNYDPDILHKFSNVHYIPSLEYLEEYFNGRMH